MSGVKLFLSFSFSLPLKSIVLLPTGALSTLAPLSFFEGGCPEAGDSDCEGIWFEVNSDAGRCYLFDCCWALFSFGTIFA